MKFIIKFSAILFLIAFAYSEPAPGRSNPNAWDVATEALVQNTVKRSNLLNSYRSNIDKNPSRYKVLGSIHNTSDVVLTSKELYAKDPKAYYPFYDESRHPQVEVSPKSTPSRPDKYDKDKKPYYNPTGEFKIKPLPPMGKDTNVVLGDVNYTFPTEKNLQNLSNQLEALKLRNMIDLNESSIKGIYIPDPRPYYDPTIDDTEASKGAIISQMFEMGKDLENQKKHNVTANIGDVKFTPEVQNKENYDSEQKLKNVVENYYTEVVTKNGKNYELPVGVTNKGEAKPTTYETSPQVDADVVKKEIVESDVENKSSRTGDVYYSKDIKQNKKHSTDKKDVKDLKANKAQSNLKNIKPRVVVDNSKIAAKEEKIINNNKK